MWKKALGYGLVVVSALFLIALGWTGYTVRRSLPRVTGTIDVEGLSAPVTIYRDSLGVPHLYASNLSDLFHAQGYVHAQDRLFQMDLHRRTATGKLSELFGRIALDMDIEARTLGFARVSEKEVLSAEQKEILEAYTRGVNSFISTHEGKWPPEYRLLRLDPELWSTVDTLAFGRYMVSTLTGAYYSEARRYRLARQIGVDRLADLYEVAHPETLHVPEGLGFRRGFPDGIAPGSGDERRTEANSVPDSAVGSNAWAVDGSLTASGAPLLANDPHLPVNVPALWYEVHLEAPTYRATGLSLPGAPLVVIGQNGRVAWGITALMADDQDLVIERVQGEGAGQYLRGATWQTFKVAEETIHVKDEPPQTIKVRETQDGPVVSELLGMDDVVTLRWTGLDPRLSFSVFSRLARANNVDELLQCWRDAGPGGFGFVAADVEGNIARAAVGPVPRRGYGDGWLPSPGWDSRYEWQGTLSADELPLLLNPDSHFVVSANHDLTQPEVEHNLGREWARPHRARRISQLIEGSGGALTRKDFQIFQSDVRSTLAEQIVERIGDLKLQGENARRGARLLSEWDLRVSVSGTSLLYEKFVAALGKEMLGDESDAWNARLSAGAGRLASLMKDSRFNWADRQNTPERIETLEEIVSQALNTAISEVEAKYGPNVSEWSWGSEHQLFFQHPLGGVPGLGHVLNLDPLPMPGDGSTVNAQYFSKSRVVIYPSARFIVDLSDMSRVFSVIPTGQAGHPFSSHYDDQQKDWNNVELHETYAGRTPPEGDDGYSVLTLNPR